MGEKWCEFLDFSPFPPHVWDSMFFTTLKKQSSLSLTSWHFSGPGFWILTKGVKRHPVRGQPCQNSIWVLGMEQPTTATVLLSLVLLSVHPFSLLLPSLLLLSLLLLALLSLLLPSLLSLLHTPLWLINSVRNPLPFLGKVDLLKYLKRGAQYQHISLLLHDPKTTNYRCYVVMATGRHPAC